MIKTLIFVSLLVLASVIYGLYWWLDSNNYSFKAILDVWPVWVLSSLVGVAIGGLIVLFMAQFAYNSDLNELEEKTNIEKTQFEKNLYDSIASRETSLRKQQQQAEEERFNASQSLVESEEVAEDAKRQIIEMRQDLEQAQKSAFNATKTVERLRKKMAKLEASRG